MTVGTLSSPEVGHVVLGLLGGDCGGRGGRGAGRGAEGGLGGADDVWLLVIKGEGRNGGEREAATGGGMEKMKELATKKCILVRNE